MKPEDIQLRISFDLDEVLFVNPATHKTEPELHFLKKRIYKERLRAGSVDLIRTLQKEGNEVWIYTSSFRTEKYIRRLFRSYGIQLDGVVNGQRHQAEVQGKRRESMPTKLPNRYRINLHIDDEDIVCTYGKTYGFDVYQLNAPKENWADEVMEQVRRIQKRELSRMNRNMSCSASMENSEELTTDKQK